MVDQELMQDNIFAIRVPANPLGIHDIAVAVSTNSSSFVSARYVQIIGLHNSWLLLVAEPIKMIGCQH